MFIFLRSVLYFISLVLVTVFFGLLISIPGWLLSYEINSRLANSWGRSNLFLLKYLVGLKYRVSGIQHLLDNQPCIIMSKHQSAWETIAFRGIFPPVQAWVLKRELLFIPVFGWALAAARQIAIDRKSAREAMKQIVSQGMDRLKNNCNVIIFPEGTRVAPGERKRYGIGGGLLAEKSGHVVIPVAHNAGVFWKRRGFKKYPGTIDVIIGEAISTQGKTAAQITREVENWIEEQMLTLPNCL